MEYALSFGRAMPPIGHAMLHHKEAFPMIPSKVPKFYVYQFPSDIEIGIFDLSHRLSDCSSPTILTLPQAIMLFENFLKNPLGSNPSGKEKLENASKEARRLGCEALRQHEMGPELFYPLMVAVNIGYPIELHGREGTLVSAWVHRNISLEFRDAESKELCPVIKTVFTLEDVLRHSDDLYLEIPEVEGKEDNRFGDDSSTLRGD